MVIYNHLTNLSKWLTMIINNQLLILKKENRVPYTIDELSRPELTLKAKNVSFAIMNAIRNYGNPSDVVGIAYLFYKLLNARSSRLKSLGSLEETALMQLERFRTGEIALNPYVLNSLLPGMKRSFVKAYKIFDEVGDEDDIYAAIVTMSDDYIKRYGGKIVGEMSTPDALVRFAQAILNIKNEEKVADICCGNGNFITKSIGIKPKANYFGYEMNISCIATLAMKTDVLGANPSVVMGDIEYTLRDSNIEFDKIFSNYPLGLRLDNYDEIMHKLPFGINRNTSDWYFNNVVIEHLAKTGKAIAIASPGSVWNEAGKDARKYFIENGYIEAVISLPGGLMSGTSIPLTAYIFSHENENIRLIDASDIVTIEGIKDKTLSDDNIKEIISLLLTDSEKSILITKDDAKAKDYSLAFRTYRSGLPKYENGTPLSEVSEIIRGTLNPRGNVAKANTGKYLLQISDIDNGIIKKDLGEDRFVELEKDCSEQKLLPYDLIISRSAQPVRIAIVSPNEKRELYPNGNMFIVRTKGSNINPYYLLSFLLSRDGQKALDMASTGNMLRTISATALSELIIPLKSITDQRKTAEMICESIAQYEAYSLKASIAQSKILNSYYCEEN